MKFYSTRNKRKIVCLKEAVLKGMPEDGGLYMPLEIPRLPKEFFSKLENLSFKEISKIISRYFLEDFPLEIIEEIVEKALNFDAPLINLSKNIKVLELFHGPTLAFKDFGARYMARLMSYLNKETGELLHILVATSGDTGSAVASGFYKVEGIKVIILYPSGKISDIQEKQITTYGENIIAIEVEGNFDDCQRLVKLALTDHELNKKLRLSSANSINIARLIPQSFYYFYAYAQLKEKGKKIIISVPSGNLGNLFGGIMAKKMGLPIDKFIAATNKNSVFKEYLNSGKFEPRNTIKTLSNAMDVGNPSNIERLWEIYKYKVEEMRKEIESYSFNDIETIKAIEEVYRNYSYILDPHGAVSYLGLKKFLEKNCYKDITGIFLETAHPAKFRDIIESTLKEKIKLPNRLSLFLKKRKKSIKISKEFQEFKEFLLKNFSSY